MPIDLDNAIMQDPKKQVFLNGNGKCQYCGLDFLSSLSLFWAYEVDHVVAKSVGGADTADNLVLSCRACNGALSRASNLRTFEERKAYLESQVGSRSEIYEAWRRHLGR